MSEVINGGSPDNLKDAGYDYNSITPSGLKYEVIKSEMIVQLGKKPIEV